MTDNLTDRRGALAGARERAGSPPGSAAALIRAGQAWLATSSSSARLEAELLLAHVLGQPRSHLLAWPERQVGAQDTGAYQQLLARAAQGEPLAYLVGEREFWSLSLTVTPAVLVPRPATELAVERCLALCPAQSALRAVDLGTGSGAIALALASERTTWRIAATDCSAAALQIARLNAARLGLSGIEFIEGNWFEPLTGRQFELIVSNPPYVGATDPALARLRHEPRQALTAGADGLQALELLIANAQTHLAPGGWLVLEHGADQGPPVDQLLRVTGYARICTHRDLAGHMRITEACWP